MKIDFKSLVSDIAAQDGAWRDVSQKAVDYYDHLQVTEDRRRQVEADCGGLALIGNLIQPAVNSVLGHEEQRRVDWMVKADDEDSEEVAEGLNQKLNETMRLCYANRYCSDAYKDQVIKGVGWLQVERNPDPFGDPYLIEQIPVSELYWDMRSRDPGLRDCRWVARRKFMDLDEAKAFFPAEKRLIDQAANEWSDFTGFQIGDESSMAEFEKRRAEWSGVPGGRANQYVFQDDQRTRRKRIAIYHVFYRSFESATALVLPTGRVEEVPSALAASLKKLGSAESASVRWSAELLALVLKVQSGARIKQGTVARMRCKWFVGPHEVSDEPSPHPHNHFPFVPFWGYRKDGSNTPYGLVEGMIDPQDAYNEVSFKIYQIIKHKRVFVAKDEFKDEGSMRLSDYVHELNREDGAIPVKDLRNIMVQHDWDKLQALRGERELHAQQIRDFSGIYNSYSGATHAGQSGVAIASAAELGATTLSELNANYQFGRKRLGELVLAHLVQDIGRSQQVIRIRSEGAGQVRRTVVLNGASQDGRANNDVVMARYQVALADVASSAGYRQHTHQRIMEMFQVGGTDPVMAPFLLELAIDTSELPNRSELLEKWRKQRGLSDDPDEQAAQQQAAQAAQQQALQLQQAKAEAEIAENRAQAEREQAHAAYYTAQAAKEIVETEELKRRQKLEEAQQRAAVMVEQRRQDAAQILERV